MRYLLTGGMAYVDGKFISADVSVMDDKIEMVEPLIEHNGFDRIFDCGEMFIIPGVADVHTHLRQPGFSYKETVKTGTQAAARGGCTLMCSMPNLKPCPDNYARLRQQLDFVDKDAVVKVIPYGSITMGETGEELSDMEGMADFVAGFSDDGKGVQDCELMRRAMLKAKALERPIVAHCEDESLLNGGYIHDGVYAQEHGHTGICSESEWKPILRDIALVRETGCRYHVCHVSTKESIALIRAAKLEGLPVSCETAPHYLVLCDENIEENGRFKMNPPLRSKGDKEELLRGVCDGTIDVIATDHAPHTEEEKSRGLADSLMGVSGIELAFKVMYTELVESGRLTPEQLVELMCVRPRELFGIDTNAGHICPQASADLAVVRRVPCGQTIDPSEMLSMGKSTPFAGRTVDVDVALTLCEGRIAWIDNEVFPQETEDEDEK